MEYTNDVNAVYTNTLTGNPLLDALPGRLSLSELYEKVSYIPTLPDNYKTMPPNDRYLLAEKLTMMYMPLDYTAIIYNLIYSGIRSAYQGKTPKGIIKRTNEYGQCIFYKTPNRLSDSITQAECFSVLGESGMGKTQTITRILKLFPQVIHHTEYDGQPFEHDQIVYIKIESPANNSPRGACLQILAAVDELLGTDLCLEERKKSSNVDMLITRIAQTCIRYSIGCIVIDEIQNILSTRSNYIQTTGGRMVNFLVELANKTGVCLAFIGTPIVSKVFDSEPHLLRRTRGPRIPALEKSTAFEKLLEIMWNNIPVLNPVPLDAGTIDLVYKITGGVIAKMQKEILLSTQNAIYFEKETVTRELLKKIAKQYNIIPGKSTLETAAPEVLTVKAAKEKNETPLDSKGKGRPKLSWDDDDILQIFAECQEKGWSVAKALIQHGLAERGGLNEKSADAADPIS